MNKGHAITNFNLPTPNGYNLIFHFDHSGPYTNGVGNIVYGDVLYKSDVILFDDSHTHHIIVDVGCSANNFSLASISKEYIKNPHGGGIGLIGSTISAGYGNDNDPSFGRFCNHFYNDMNINLNHLGDAFNIGFGSCEFSFDRRRFNLLGDPTLEIWGKEPIFNQLQLSANLGSLVTGPNNLSITITNLPNGQNARYCISKENEVYFTDEAIGNGSQITIPLDPEKIKPETTGLVNIVLTAKNYLPITLPLQVNPSPNANLFVSSISILDNVSPSSGNNDGKADAGETFNLELTLQNSGGTSSGVINNATISFAQGGPPASLQITNGSANFPNIDPNTSAIPLTPFQMVVDDYCQDLKKRELIITIPSLGQTDNFFITPHAPKITIYETTITTNQPNNIICAGVEVEIAIEFQNSGSGTAFPGTATLSVSAQTINVTMLDPVSSYNEIQEYSYGELISTFKFKLNDDWTTNSPLVFTVTLTPDQQIGPPWSLPLDLYIPGQITGVEGEGFSNSIKLKWTVCQDCKGYNVYRSNNEITGFEKINAEIIPHYAYYEDINLQTVTSYFYKVSAISDYGVEGPLSIACEVYTTLPFHEGWPLEVMDEIGSITEGSPITEDVDRDLNKEIFLTIHGDKIGAILGFKENGEEYVEYDHNTTSTGGFYHFINENGDGASATSTPAIADIDEDGSPELLVTTHTGNDSFLRESIFVFSTTEVDNYGYPIVEKSRHLFRDLKGPVVAGIETDNPDQIASKSDWGSGFSLINSTSSTLDDYVDQTSQNVWPVVFTNQCPPTNGLPVIADLDNIGGKEYIIGINKKMVTQYCSQPTSAGIYIWNSDKTSFKPNTLMELPFFSVPENHRMDSPPIVADIDNDPDQKQEILCVSSEDIANGKAYGHVFILDINGECIENWQYNDNYHKIPLTIEGGIDVWLPALSVGDINDDGELEIFIADKGKIHGWKSDGSYLEGYPIEVQGIECRFIAPLIADIDGIPDPVTHKQDFEVIVASNSTEEDYQGLYAYKINSREPVPGWPLKCGKVLATPCIDDVDADGKNEIIASSGNKIYMWDTEGSANYTLWGKFRLNNENNAVYSEPCNYIPNQPLEITSDETWFNGKNIHTDIIIKPGATLTINGTINMAPESKIIIEPSQNPTTIGGGKLLLDGGKLTTKCEGLWQGIEVWGLPNALQTDRTSSGDLIQGQVEIINGGAILNAEIGILASKRASEENEREYGYTGGFIFADNAYFVNNKIAVQMDPYPNPNGNMFQDCQFLTTGKLVDGSDAHESFLKLIGVRTITIKGCTFKNTRRESEVHYLNRGTGIFSENSDFNVNSLCLDPVVPCENFLPTRFEKLTRGIYAMNSGESTGLYIAQTEFLDNHKGLYISGFTELANARIHSNKFRNSIPDIFSYGMYLNECSGYHVEDNEFYEVSQTPTTIGLIVNNSLPLPNEIYRNRFYNLKFATLSENVNRNADPSLGGLCFKCNKFVNQELEKPNFIDLAVTFNGQPGNSTGIAQHQGTLLNGTSYAPAGNMFIESPPSFHYDFYSEWNTIIYYFPIDGIPDYRFDPNQSYSYGPFTQQPVIGTFSEDNCPSKLEENPKDEDKETYEEATSESEGMLDELTLHVDGGSTTYLNLEVATSTPPESLQTRDELLSESPYLSDTVMKTSITKENVLDNTMIRDVLVANPQSAKSDQILNMLEDRVVPMPDYMISQILLGEQILSEKEILEAKRAYWEGERGKAYVRLMDHYKGDTIVSTIEDSLTWLFLQKNTLQSYYEWAIWNHHKGQYNKRDSILQLLNTTFSMTPYEQLTHQNYINFFNVSEEIASDTNRVFCLDSIQTLALQNLMAENNEIPGAFARNILITDGKIDYLEPIILPDTSLKSSKRERYKGVQKPDDIDEFMIYPNPAKDYFTVEYHFETSPSQGFISIHDIHGKKMGSYNISCKDNQVIIPIKHLKPGMYFVTLYIKGKNIDSRKISVIR